MKFEKSRPDDLPESVRLKAFWQWFMSTAEIIVPLLELGHAQEIAAIVDPQIRALTSRVGWDIGPGQIDRYSFAITLNGTLENLEIAQAIVKLAPKMPGWEIHVGRPRKKWDGRFSLRNQQGQMVWLDCSNWRYVLTGYDGNSFFDITVIADWSKLDLAARQQAAQLVIESEVGELVMLQRFDKINTEECPSPEMLERTSSIRDLKDHLAYLDSNRPERK